MDTGKVLLGLLAGVATGALLGILFAPDKGSRTRKRIVNEGEELRDDLKEKFDEFVDGLSDKFDKVKKDVSDFADNVTNKEKEAEKDLKKAKH